MEREMQCHTTDVQQVEQFDSDLRNNRYKLKNPSREAIFHHQCAPSPFPKDWCAWPRWLSSNSLSRSRTQYCRQTPVAVGRENRARCHRLHAQSVLGI